MSFQSRHQSSNTGLTISGYTYWHAGTKGCPASGRLAVDEHLERVGLYYKAFEKITLTESLLIDSNQPHLFWEKVKTLSTGELGLEFPAAGWRGAFLLQKIPRADMILVT